MKIFHHLFKRFQFLIIATSTALLIILFGLVIQLIITKIDNKIIVDSNIESIPNPSLAIPKNNTDNPSLSHFPVAPESQDSFLSSSSLLKTPQIKSFKQNDQNNIIKMNQDIHFNQDKSIPNLPQLSASSNKTKQHFNHFYYSENTRKNLIKVANYYNRNEFLDHETADAFKRMQLDAKNNGVDLIIISGFRSVSDQGKLFENQTERRGSKEKAAKLSAPPGFSEHHTGFAMDIGDGKMPDTDLKFSFEKTPAYLWLVQNANNYGFELSFPPNNPQGVSFEPWHWRYVISQRANQVFYEARKFYEARR
jgi:zinc D-Ala-D-Ala carboxypeptidase